jgi:tetratricopeptide (TPR) repeat protein
MTFSSRKMWVLAGITVLGMGVFTVVVCSRMCSRPDELAAKSRLALKNRQWSRAESLLKRVARGRAPTADDIALRAELEFGRGRVDQAVTLLTATPESDPKAGRSRLVAGQIEMTRDRAVPAEALFLEAIRLDPSLTQARRELILLYAMQARRADLNVQFRALAELEPLDFDDVFLWTNSLEDRWVNDLIRPHLERFLAADPLDRVSRLALAAVVLRAGNLDNCEALLRALPDSDADARVLRARLALFRLQDGAAHVLVAEGPIEHLELALLRGQSAVQENNPAAAARQFRLALQLDPANRTALEGLSIVLKQLGDTKAAAPIQKRAEQWRHLTSLLQKSKTFDLRHDKTLITQLGEACEALGQQPEARAWYRLALGLDPLDQDVQRALFRLGDHTKKRPAATETSPKSGLTAETGASSP